MDQLDEAFNELEKTIYLPDRSEVARRQLLADILQLREFAKQTADRVCGTKETEGKEKTMELSNGMEVIVPNRGGWVATVQRWDTLEDGRTIVYLKDNDGRQGLNYLDQLEGKK